VHWPEYDCGFFEEDYMAMHTRAAWVVLIGLGLVAMNASAQELTVKEPWVRGTVKAQKATGAFMELTSKDGSALVGASSPVAGIVEVHEMAMENNVMKMRAIPKLDLPAGKAVQLKPGGYHIMLMELKQQLKKGDTVPITLKVEGRDKSVKSVELKAEVRDLASAAGPAHKH
jgi:hypothetical protein